MRKLLNTLYVTSENSYLSLDGENVVVLEDKTEIGRVPLHNLEGIVPGNQSGINGSLCREKYFTLLSYTPGEISGEGLRAGQRKRGIKTAAVYQCQR